MFKDHQPPVMVISEARDISRSGISLIHAQLDIMTTVIQSVGEDNFDYLLFISAVDFPLVSPAQMSTRLRRAELSRGYRPLYVPGSYIHFPTPNEVMAGVECPRDEGAGTEQHFAQIGRDPI